MNVGKIFENDWKNSIDKKLIYYFRLKDSPSSFGANNNNVRFTLNNPYDSFLFYNCHLFPMELKSTKDTSFSFQRTKQDKGKKIKLHQIEGLLEASKYQNIIAGFVFNFRKETDNVCYWLDINNFILFMNSTTKGSINEKDIQEFGGIVVSNEKKKVHYRYAVQELLDGLIKDGDIIAEKDIS